MRTYIVPINDVIKLEFVYIDNNLVLGEGFSQEFSRFIKISRFGENMFVIKMFDKTIAAIDAAVDVLVPFKVVFTSLELRNVAMLVKSLELRDKQAFNDYSSNYHMLTVPNKKDVKSETDTDLHTHFMEMLSPEDFLKVIARFTNGIVLNGTDVSLESDNPNNELVPMEEIMNNKTLLNVILKQLSLPIGEQVTMEELSVALKKRNVIIDEAAEYLIKYIPDDGKTFLERRSDAKAFLYVEILRETLKDLKKKGVRYAELSYSNPNTILKMYDLLQQEPLEEGTIDFAFLLSENRKSDIPTFRKAVRKLNALFNEGKVVGFDFMGMESPINDLDFNIDMPGTFGFNVKSVLNVLAEHRDRYSVLRLHAGEEVNCGDNPLRTLKIIDSVVQQHNKNNKEKWIIPPPYIRLGHALHFEHSQEYLDLLREYKVVIEINASSNFALSNMQDLKKLPYNWYLENNIPFVLGTDGAGFYYTSTTQEQLIGLGVGGSQVLQHASDTEKDIHRKRVGG